MKWIPNRDFALVAGIITCRRKPAGGSGITLVPADGRPPFAGDRLHGSGEPCYAGAKQDPLLRGGYETWRATSSYLELQASRKMTESLWEMLSKVAK